MPQWFEDETFWIDWYPYMFPSDRFEKAPEQVDQLLELSGFQGKTILDLCCGPGRHAVELAERGYAVTGVDRTPFLLQQARQKAEERKVKVEWVQDDMLRFCRPESFDLILSMFTSFGYFDREADNQTVLENVYSSLRPGGTFVIDVAGKEVIARKFASTSSEVADDGTRLMQRHEIVAEWSRIRNEWHMIQGDRARSFEFQHTLYSGKELQNRVRKAGFHTCRLYGGLDGSVYGPLAKRLVTVAHKRG